MLRSAFVNTQAAAEAAGALGLELTVTRESTAAAVVSVCDGVPTRRSLQRARHRSKTWLVLDGALPTLATLPAMARHSSLG